MKEYSIFLVYDASDYDYINSVRADSALEAIELFKLTNYYIINNKDIDDHIDHYEKEDKVYLSWGERYEYYYVIQESE